MIFYNPAIDKRLPDYGIEIPIAEERSGMVFKQLSALDPTLKYFDPEIIPEITRADLELAHNPQFVSKLLGNYAELEREMLICFELISENGIYHRYNPKNATKDFRDAFDKILKQAGMTYYAAKDSLQSGFSYFLGGGMHHAMSFGGRGFCLINDIVIAIRKLQKEKLIKSAWVIDVDAHKGDGTAELTKNDPSIGTLSIHMKEGWPLDSGSIDDPWFIPSKIDIEIGAGEEGQYLTKLKAGLLELERLFPKPDLAIVVNGADPYEYDELSSTNQLKLTALQLLERDILVYEFLGERKIPQSYVMAGGYGKRSWEVYAQFLKFVWESSPERPEVSSR
ncbi:MAG: histone deacetylase [Bacteriovorax sp.]|jgi:acetoin utilization deacetylase AcuC-like enzyme